MRRTLASRTLDVICGFLAYAGARLVWSSRDVLSNLHWELLTFAALYLLLQAAVRGWKMAREGRKP